MKIKSFLTFVVGLLYVCAQPILGNQSPLESRALLTRNLITVLKAAFQNPVKNSKDLKLIESTFERVKSDFSKKNAHQLFQKNKDKSNCVNSLETFMVDLIHREPYALKMLDAWAKPESGIAQGNLQWNGRYYECEAITHNASMFKGQWCSAIVGNVATSAVGFFPTGALMLGTCFPDTCSAENITDFFNGFLNYSLPFTISCPGEPHHWNGLSIFALFLTCLLILFVILGTSYELYKIREQKLNEDDEPLLNDFDGIGKKFAKDILSSFSIVKNTTVLLDTQKKEGNIHCLHGMRFISMTWVILGHIFVFAFSYMDNLVDLASFSTNHFSFMAILSGTFSVDSFFFLSGLLVAFLGMREITKRKGKINIPLMYLSRYLRLTPAYAFCMLFSVSIYKVIGDGPYWLDTVDALKSACDKYWWTNLLYINNLYPISMTNECFGWGWYLANDMQFYLIAPFFLILLYRKPIFGVISLVFGTICSIAITGSLSSYYAEPTQQVQMGQLSKAMGGVSDLMNQRMLTAKGNMTGSQADVLASDLYAKPWCRVGVYFIGMITGYIVYATHGQLKMNKIMVAIGWLITVAMEMALVYGLYGHVHDGIPLSVNAAAFYNAVSRPLWAVGLGWVVIACVNGYGGPVNRFLSWKGFIPLSRLTYTCYLVHPLLLFAIYGTQEVQVHYILIVFVCYFLAAVVLANGFGYVVSMLVEAPMSGIQKAIFPKSKPAPKPIETFDEDYLDNSSNHVVS